VDLLLRQKDITQLCPFYLDVQPEAARIQVRLFSRVAQGTRGLRGAGHGGLPLLHSVCSLRRQCGMSRLVYVVLGCWGLTGALACMPGSMKGSVVGWLWKESYSAAVTGSTALRGGRMVDAFA
jgi:hypothetical protein